MRTASLSNFCWGEGVRLEGRREGTDIEGGERSR
jgi:hypothetical protein